MKMRRLIFLTELGRTGGAAPRIFIAGLVFLAMGLALWGALLFTGGGSGDEERVVLLPRGSSLTKVSEILAKEGVVSSAGLFKLALRTTPMMGKVRAGEFNFKTNMSHWEALKIIYFGSPIVHQVTVPEGWAVRQIAQVLAAQKLVDEQKFIQMALNPDAPKKFGITSPSLEGFLFPDTYDFSRVDGEERILERMVGEFMEHYQKEFKHEAEARGWSINQLVTLASIIEKETGVHSEREMVSSVFHNRLKKKMRLQSDPTTIYGISNFNGNITKKDLHTYSPYNTYVINGLPPGPIASPGAASLHAALNPATSNYLFFVANNKGGHTFSETYAEHTRHVNNFQVTPHRKRK